MENLPDIAIVIDQKREITAIRECKKLGIPVVSILDTNCDPDLVDIPIPGNDDALRAVRLFASRISDAIVEGNQIATEGGVVAEEGEKTEETAGATEGASTELPTAAKDDESASNGAQPETTSEIAEGTETDEAPDESAESVVAAS